MRDAALDRLLAAQSASGAFPSRVEGPDGPVDDETCFVTAQVTFILLALLAREPGHRGAARDAIERTATRALDFVETCAADSPVGAFAFYPPRGVTPRLDLALPPDADDTALAWLALMAGGRRTPAQARALLPRLFCELRVAAARRGDPPFVRPPLLRTWFTSPDAPNPVDLIVNINVLAVLAVAGCPHETFSALALRVRAALPSMVPTGSQLRTLAPYYAHGAELGIAVARAVALGVQDLAMPTEARSAADIPGREGRADPLDRPLYCNAHGRPIWRAPALQLARQCHAGAFPVVHQCVDPFTLSGGSHAVHVQLRRR